jgi:glutamate 5-kinase
MKKSIVIKIGSSILITEKGRLNSSRISHIAKQVSILISVGQSVVLVVSGAVASGATQIGSVQTNKLRQLAAGIGQAILTSQFLKNFKQEGLQIAQILLTKTELDNNRDNAKSLLDFYVDSGIIPFINENDVISLNSFQGNDLLASEIASLIKADELLILSTFDKSTFGVGGGESKIKALEILKSKKIKARILNGKQNNIILEAAL